MRETEHAPERFGKISTEYGEVMYAEYTYRGVTYRQLELELEQEMQIGEILAELDISNLRSLSDLVNIKLGMFISAALKNRVAPRLLSIVLTRADGKPVADDEFSKGLAREFNPFFKEVAADFFSLNSEVLEPITRIAKKVGQQVGVVTEFLAYLKSSMPSLKEISRNGPA